MRLLALGLTCAAVAVLPLFAVERPAQTMARTSWVMPSTFRGQGLVECEIDAREKSFYVAFPGQVKYARLADRAGEFVWLRFTDQPTRMLHPADLCYKAGGYTVQHDSIVRETVPELSAQPLEWSRCLVSKDQHAVELLQTVVSVTTGKSYPDIPGWYWQTMFTDGDPGPWLAIAWKRPISAS